MYHHNVSDCLCVLVQAGISGKRKRNVATAANSRQPSKRQAQEQQEPEVDLRALFCEVFRVPAPTLATDQQDLEDLIQVYLDHPKQSTLPSGGGICSNTVVRNRVTVGSVNIA